MGGLIEEKTRWEEEMYWKHFHAMHFYQVLPKDFLHHLALPSKFVKNMANKLPSKVSLIGPSGATWDVDLLKSRTGSLDFAGDGWTDFAKAHNLEHNFVIALKYKQNSSFEALIFDHNSSCEKESSYFVRKGSPKREYRTDRKRCVSEAASTEVVEDNDDDGDIGGSSDCVRSKKPKKGTCEQGRTNNLDALRMCPSDEFSEDNHNDLDFVVSDKAVDDISVEVIDWGGRKNRQRSTRGLSNEAAVEDGRGPSNTPKSKSHTVKKLSDGNISRILNESDEMEQIPTENRKKEMLENVLLSDVYHSCKPGVIRSRVVKHTTPRRSKKLAFRGGDSGLKRLSTKDYISHRRPVSSKEKDVAFRLANEAYTKGDFVVVLPRSAVYYKFFLSFPSDWINKNMANRDQEVILRAGEKTWVTLYRPRANSSGHIVNSGGLTRGWKDFAIQNNLDISDVCLFKPTSKKDDPTLILDVQIFRVVEESTPLICSV